ncbi:amidohydrolase family protein [Halorussus salilacus]|uniref:amidohydrolase family protein n=1 Tax=Halorussus salilacus TaxID=2953750 RepID=UPI00209E7369|nr:amidohydrolase family protein [Halorussus salilacus]USZ68952.1 amidohydrolase family protein [Halorussus salilacus]
MLELEHRFRVVDVHARLNADAGGVQTRGRAISPDRLEREMHQAGVVRSVVFPGPRPEGSYVSANNAVARRSVDRPFLAFARIDGPRDPGETASSRLRNLTARRQEHHTSPEDVEQYAYDDRFHGFKLDPVEDGLPDEETLDQLEDVDLPVLVHGGEGYPPAAVADTLLSRSFPVVLAHFGGHPLNRELMTDAIDLLERHDECYLDTSYVRYRDLLERAVMEHPDRVLFGSGAPSSHPNVAVMEILTLDVPEDAMRKVFDKNPSRVIDGLARDGE